MVQVVPDRRPEPDERLESLSEHLTFIDLIEDGLTVLKTSRKRYTTERFKAHIEEELQTLRRLKHVQLVRLLKALKAYAELAQRSCARCRPSAKPAPDAHHPHA